MNKLNLFRLLTLMLPILLLQSVSAQQVNFTLQGSEQLIITRVTGNLDFNDVTDSGRPFYLAGEKGSLIDLTKNQDMIAIFRVEAPNHLDVNVDVSATSFSLVCSDNCPSPIPELEFQLGWAYWNRSVSNDVVFTPSVDQLLPAAREVLSATGIPLNFGSATFPMRQRSVANTAPPAPPIPDHDGYNNVPATSAFILVYGRLGDIPVNIQPGSYEATITVSASLPIYQ